MTEGALVLNRHQRLDVTNKTARLRSINETKLNAYSEGEDLAATLPSISVNDDGTSRKLYFAFFVR